ncbi:MAG: hypothetical protein H7Y11_07095 [Armatimonadetes bacterium]|nr:hypothetical protein [Anaerolineae bacterium]
MKILKTVIPVGLWCLLTACGAATTTTTPVASVTLSAPPDGAVIYASALDVAGVYSGTPPNTRLSVLVVDATGQSIARSSIDATADAPWSLEVVHGYTGDAQPMTVQVLAPDGAVLASSTVLFAPLSERPDGAFITLLTPENGRTIGGDAVLVSGTASGIRDNRLTLTLTGDDGSTVATQSVTLAGRYPMDELPWSATLPLGDYTGNAILRATYHDGQREQTESLSVSVTGSAG